MKKLNKLLPIVGLSTIAAAGFPLTSCNKGGDTPKKDEITEQDWKNAIDFLLGETEEECNWYSSEDDVSGEQSFYDKERTITQYNTWNDVIYNNGDYYAKTTNVRSTKREVYHEYSTLFENFNFNAYVTENQSAMNSPNWDYYLTNKAIDAVFVFLRSIYDNFSEFVYDKTTETYSWNGEFKFIDYTFKSVLTDVKFNKNKKMSYFDTTFEELDEEGKQVRVATLRLHFNYGKKTINYPSWYKAKVEKLINVSDAKGVANLTDLSGTLQNPGQVIKFTVPEDDMDKIVVTDPETGKLVDWLVHEYTDPQYKIYEPGVMIVKNKQLLIHGEDKETCDYVINTSGTTGGNTITFYEKLKKGDNISVWVKPQKLGTWSWKGTFTLTK